MSRRVLDVSELDIESWLDQNGPFLQQYLLKKKTDIAPQIVHEWLTGKGLKIIPDENFAQNFEQNLTLLGIPQQSASTTSTTSSNTIGSQNSQKRQDSSSPALSPEPSPTSSGGESNSALPELQNQGISRNNSSKKSLRNDFARAKSRSVYQDSWSTNVHQCPEIEGDTNGPLLTGVTNPSGPSGHSHGPTLTASRRSSLKEMRKYSSLPPNSINILSLLIESKVRIPRVVSKNLENKQNQRKNDERGFFLDIVKDIANDLDLKSLTRKVTENISVLLDAESAALYLIEGPKSCQRLVSKANDDPLRDLYSYSFHESVESRENGDSGETWIPLGKGILGWVGESGQPLNLQVASLDPRYNESVDRMGGKPTGSLISQPVRAASGDEEIIAVAQAVNKNQNVNFGCFNREDEKLLEMYLQFVGIALTNAQVMESARREFERNRALLEVVHDLFEEQTCIKKVICKIMQRALRLLDCERAALLLLDTESSNQALVFSKLYELSSPSSNSAGNCNGSNGNRPKAESTNLQFRCYENPEEIPSNLLQLAEQVVLTGEVVVENCSSQSQKSELKNRAKNISNIKSLIAMPIRNRNSEVIGVATVFNKQNNLPFEEHEEQLFEAFSLFCGLGILNTMQYAELEVSIARQKVALEMLSYHATAPMKEIESMMDREVPKAEDIPGLCSLRFDDFSLDSTQMPLAALRIFYDLGLVTKFKIDRAVLTRLVLTIQRNYRDVPYHNFRHAFNVCQVMFAIFVNCQEIRDIFSELELFGMLLSCLCHDLDHRGLNNSFQAKTGSPLALLYGTQNTMEQHHFNHSIMIINSEGHNILSGLTPEQYAEFMNILRNCILATDLTIYFQKRAKFLELISTRSYNWTDKKQKEILRCMLMTASDLAASTKDWEVQRRVADLVTSEFFAQGDQERQQLQITPQAPMDRERVEELPQLQRNWIRDICLPLYQNLTDLNENFSEMRDRAQQNMLKWESQINQ